MNAIKVFPGYECHLGIPRMAFVGTKKTWALVFYKHIFPTGLKRMVDINNIS